MKLLGMHLSLDPKGAEQIFLSGFIMMHIVIAHLSEFSSSGRVKFDPTS